MSLVYPSSDLKKELLKLNSTEIATVCWRLARFKKENKELLTFLLFKADDTDAFTQEYKEEMDLQFSKITGKSFNVVKTLRKIAQQMNNQIRYAATETVTIELLLHFCKNYIKYVNYHTQYKPLRSIFYRFAEKLKASILKLQEDLQYDYGLLYEEMLTAAAEEIYWFEKGSLSL